MLHMKPKTKDVPGTHGYVSDVQGTPRGHLCVCGKSYVSRGALRQHVSRQRLSIAFKCPNCVAQYSDCFILKLHMRRCHGHSDYDVYGCYVCGASFPNRRELSLHKADKNHSNR